MLGFEPQYSDVRAHDSHSAAATPGLHGITEVSVSERKLGT